MKITHVGYSSPHDEEDDDDDNDFRAIKNPPLFLQFGWFINRIYL